MNSKSSAFPWDCCNGSPLRQNHCMVSFYQSKFQSLKNQKRKFYNVRKFSEFSFVMGSRQAVDQVSEDMRFKFLAVLGSNVLFFSCNKGYFVLPEKFYSDQLNCRQKSHSAFTVLATFSLCWSQSGLLY